MLHKVENRRKKKNFFTEDLSREWTIHHAGELIIGMEDIDGHVGRRIDGFQEVHRGLSPGERNVEERMLLEFCEAKHLGTANTWYRKADKMKITYGSGCNESEIDFCIMKKVDHKFSIDVKVITGEL